MEGRRRIGRVENPNLHLYLEVNTEKHSNKTKHVTNKSDSNFVSLLRRGSERATKASQQTTGIIVGASLILQTVIGPGIFTSPKGVVKFGGSIGVSYLIWACSGIFSTLAALCFVELQLSVPRAGCEYGYIHKAFGKLPTFIYTWMRIALAEPVTTAVFTLAFADYVADTLFDKCGPSDTIKKLLAVLAVITLTIMNGFLKTLAQGINYLANCGKIVTLLIIICVGLYNIIYGNVGVLREGFDHSKTSYDSIALAFYNSLWAYGGWANVPHVTSGVKKPPRNLPILILTVIPFVTCVYLLAVTSFFSVLSRDEMIGAEAIGVKWGEQMYGPFGKVIPIFVCFIALGNANGTFMTVGRTASVAVHDGYIPEILSYIHIRTQIHVPAVAGRCVAAIGLIFLADAGALVRFYVFSVWLFHGITVLGLLTLRWRRRKTTNWQYKVPIIVPILVLIFCTGIIIGPFTVWPPRKEFVFSVAVVIVSAIGFVIFGKAKKLFKYFDWVALLVQLLMNTVPPKIDRHKQKVINVPRKRKFTPTSKKFPETLNSVGRFSSTSSPLRLRKTSSTSQKSQEDIARKISTVSQFSVDYCDVINTFDEASCYLDDSSLTNASYSIESAQSIITPNTTDTHDSYTCNELISKL